MIFQQSQSEAIRKKEAVRRMQAVRMQREGALLAQSHLMAFKDRECLEFELHISGDALCTDREISLYAGKAGCDIAAYIPFVGEVGQIAA